MKFTYNCTIAILVNGKIVETFINKKVTPCCNAAMKNYVVTAKGYTYESFTLLKM